MNNQLRIITPRARAFIRDVMNTVTSDCYVLKQFGEKHQIQRAMWDRVPADIRERFIKQEYVEVLAEVVLLTGFGMAVLAYRERAVA